MTLVDLVKQVHDKGIFIVRPSLERWSTKAKETPSPHEVRLTLQDSNPIF